MSLRNIRKIFGNNQLLPEDLNNFEPASDQEISNQFEVLEISSRSDGDFEKDVSEDEMNVTSTAKKNKKKKNKKKHHIKNQELDEIDRSLSEVNAMLGEPEEAPEVKPTEDPKQIMKKLFTIRSQYFEPDAELTRTFGPDTDKDPKKRGLRSNLRLTSQKRKIIKTDKIYESNGLSMELVKSVDDLTFFAFKHNKRYKRLHSSFIDAPPPMTHLCELLRTMHVEGLLEFADRFYYMENYVMGNRLIEEVISYMEQCAHPLFSVTNMRVRLLYKHVENRPFHIALLKYLHILTNKACHRTALEVAKLLLNLDPSDPLAVLFIIDTIAIRAMEYEWLIEAIEYWTRDRDADSLFNMLYSLALAQFHRFKETNDGYEKSCVLLKKAMTRFPSVVVEIMKIAGIRNEKITSSQMFKPERSDRSHKLEQLIKLYARFIWNKFVEKSVQTWFISNAITLVDDYDSDPTSQAVVQDYKLWRMNVFQTYPSEIIRHLSIITPFSDLTLEGAVPEIEDDMSSYNPAPPLADNSCERQDNSEGSSSIVEFVTSIMPDYEMRDANMYLIEDAQGGHRQEFAATITNETNTNQYGFQPPTNAIKNDDHSK